MVLFYGLLQTTMLLWTTADNNIVMDYCRQKCCCSDSYASKTGFASPELGVVNFDFNRLEQALQSGLAELGCSQLSRPLFASPVGYLSLLVS